MSVEELISLLPAGRVEYHRNALALVPEKNDSDPGLAVLLVDEKTGKSTLSCGCKASTGLPCVCWQL